MATFCHSWIILGPPAKVDYSAKTKPDDILIIWSIWLSYFCLIAALWSSLWNHFSPSEIIYWQKTRKKRDRLVFNFELIIVQIKSTWTNIRKRIVTFRVWTLENWVVVNCQTSEPWSIPSTNWIEWQLKNTYKTNRRLTRTSSTQKFEFSVFSWLSWQL